MKLAIVLAVCLAAVGNAQNPADSATTRAQEFVTRARAATERFKDVNVAVQESYVKVGPDFPAMGEHWVNGELVMKDQLDAARPAILTYATINGERKLIGVVYALALKQGQAPPNALHDAQWHDHVGTIDEESLLFGHDHHSTTDEIRLVVMHAWIWTPNPSGTFATDNWALPFIRVGAVAPATLTADMASAMSLVSGGAPYYSHLFASVGELSDEESAKVNKVLDRHAFAAEKWWKARGQREVSAEALKELRDIWVRVQGDVRKAVRATSYRKLSRLWVQAESAK